MIQAKEQVLAELMKMFDDTMEVGEFMISDAALAWDVPRSTAKYRLQALVGNGTLTSRLIYDRRRVYRYIEGIKNM